LFYLPVLAGVFFLARKNRATLARFLLGALPFAAIWAITNIARSGAPLALGYANSNPVGLVDYLSLRFGSGCGATLGGAVQVALQTFSNLFFGPRLPLPVLQACGYNVEARLPPPFIGPVILVLALAGGWTLARQPARRWEPLFPALGFLALLAAYGTVGPMFADRYAGDFWPLLLVLFAQCLAFLRFASRSRALLAAIALGLTAWGADAHAFKKTAGIVDREQDSCPYHRPAAAELARRLPTRATCGAPLPKLWGNGVGWAPDCKVDTVTNLILGLPEGDDSHLRLTFETASSGQPPPTIGVYIDGARYTAARDGSRYTAHFALRNAPYQSPNILISVRWDRLPRGENLRLLSLGIEPDTTLSGVYRLDRRKDNPST
jgi:hypothetical protein